MCCAVEGYRPLLLLVGLFFGVAFQTRWPMGFPLQLGKAIPEERSAEVLPSPKIAEIAGEPNVSSKCRDRLSLPSFHWGWAEACSQTAGGDEACELFLSSMMYQDPSLLVETAMRSSDASYHPDTRRLKARLVQAVLAERPLKIIVLGPSTTAGRGCIEKKQMRWTDALQNLSNSSAFKMRVINENRRATAFKHQWRDVLNGYKDDTSIDLVIVDYTVTATDYSANRRSAVMSHAFVQAWPRPPAMLFLETFTMILIEGALSSAGACNASKNFGSFDPFYDVIKTLQLPSLSYPDIACKLPALNRTSASLNGLPFLHAYKDIGNNIKFHYGCGVHLILAQTVHLYLNKMLQDSCDAGYAPQRCGPNITSDVCSAGFKWTLQDVARSDERRDFNWSQEEACEMNVQTYWAHLNEAGFAAFVSNTSKWHYGAERPNKFGWIANQSPSILNTDADLIRKHKHYEPKQQQFPAFSKLPDTDIVFLVQLSSKGMVFIDYLSSYENIGSASCRLETLQGQPLGDWLQIDGLWSQHMSISTRATLAMKKPSRPGPSGPNGFNSAVRCREEGKKFKLLGITSC